MYQKLFQNLAPSDVIITANRRLTAYLYERHNEWQQQNQQNTWLTPTILPWTNWLEQIWQDNQLTAANSPLKLLTLSQEQIIWEQIIANSVWGKNLLHLGNTAQLAREAWTLSQQWQLHFDTQKFSVNEDILAWQAWANEFNQHCDANNWLDTARLPTYIAQCIEQNFYSYTKKLYLIGFNELTPQAQQLLDTVKKHGGSYQLIEPQQFTPNIQKLALADARTEIQTMARWCQQQLLADADTNIGCVVPNLSGQRTQLINIFSEFALPFNIAGGLMLHEYPLIHIAFALLNITEEASLNEVSALLRSPFINGAEQEMAARAELDVILRQQGAVEIICQQVITLAKQHSCPIFGEQLQKLIQFQQKHTALLYPSQWAPLFARQLALCGWPGERTLISSEYQLYERWQELLAELASCDAVLGQVNRQTAYHRLYKLAHTPFQPQSANTPIQILSELEAIGLEFKQLWLMGLHDEAWPPPAVPNPFIPYQLQRQLKLPHSSGEHELHYYCAIQNYLIHSAAQVIVSYPQHAEECPLRASQLIADVPAIDIMTLGLTDYQSHWLTLLNTAHLEQLNDEKAPSITPAERISGGSAILKHQAACPFQAFARFRLSAEGLATTNVGLSAREKGALLHRVLEALWNKIKDQTTLLNFTEPELQHVIQQAIDTALLSSVKAHPLTFKKYFTELEKKRLAILLNNWLEQEKQRPPFKVLAIEQAQDFTINQIPLKLRIDRIDELNDGTRVIIDYKTGNVSISSWLGERPDEPQLPIYCVTSTQPVKALLFAQIKNNKTTFQGIAAEDLQIKGVKNFKDWQALLNTWQIELEKLAQEFYEGHAVVNPKYAEQTCQLCDLQLLCRIKEK